jgi:hypothetical protein
MGSRVELFERIRRDRDREGLSIRALAERHSVHRRAVRQALASPPPARKRPGGSAPKLGAYRPLIDAWLEGDRAAPRKQRHTARRIWRRLLDEHGADAAESTVREYVRRRRRAMGWPVGEVLYPAGPRAGGGGRGRLGRGAGRPGGGATRRCSCASYARATRVPPSAPRRWSRPSRLSSSARRGVRVVRRRLRVGAL